MWHWLSFLLALRAACAAPSCLDHDGKAVDWYFIYKQPNGFDYAYHDAHSTSGTIPVMSGRSLKNTVNNPLGKTLHQIYEHKKDYGYMLYNDEDPITGEKTADGTAHAKGVLAADSTGYGFWLIHSVPKFPDLRSTDFTWEASTVYGQTFLCVTLDNNMVDLAAKQLQYSVIHIFESNAPQTISDALPNMADTISGKTRNGTAITSFSTTGNAAFTHIVKDPFWGQARGLDFYADLVQPHLGESLYVETWRRAPFSDTFCTFNTSHSYDTMNVQSVDFGAGREYEYTKDHSKWAISTSSSEPYVCVGDINRMPSQRKRGGGTMCFTNAALHAGLFSVIKERDYCKDKPPSPAPGPAPGPTPPPSPSGTCCYSSDVTCHAGQTCCAGSGSSYETEGACNRYGKKHHCTWKEGICVVAGAASIFV